MVTLRTLASIICLSLVLIAPSAHAFDGNREGFILGGGLGFGGVSVQQRLLRGNLELRTESEGNFAIATDFKIGGGVTENLLVYYHSRGAHMSAENPSGDDVVVSTGLSGIGVSYYFDGYRTYYVSGTIGVASWTPRDDATWFGPGLLIGGGYEFVPHWSVDATLGLGSPGDKQRKYDLKTDVTNFLVTVTALAY